MADLSRASKGSNETNGGATPSQNAESAVPQTSEEKQNQSRSVREGESYVVLDSETRAREDAEIAALDAAMVREGVYLLSNERRAELARKLHALHVESDDVALMSEFVRESEPKDGDARRYLAGILGSQDALTAAIERVRIYREKWGKTKPERELAPGEGIRMENMQRKSSHEQEAEWARMRMARMALAMHRGDRWDLERIAKELQRTPDVVQQLIAEAEAMEKDAKP